jgi:hypothetical protein
MIDRQFLAARMVAATHRRLAPPALARIPDTQDPSRVSLDDWILALHVLSAFAFIGALVLFWILVVAVRRTDLPDVTVGMGPVARIGTVATGIGAIGTIVFGVWLAISKDEYQVWDGWVIGALVLWAISMETGRRTGVEYTNAMKKAEELRASGQTGPSAELWAMNRTPTGVLMQTATSVLALLILIDMIWKPGA